MSTVEAISLYQPLMYRIAYQIVGSVDDAQDIVQDTFEKWLSVENKSIENTKAYLIQAVRNNSIKFKQSLNSRVKKVSDAWADFEDAHQFSSVFKFDAEAQLSEAWHVLQHKLEPLERKIYVLREVFNVEYDELQKVFDKKSDNLRKIVSRAKAKLSDYSPSFHYSFRVNVPKSFQDALHLDQFQELMMEWKKEIQKKVS